VDMVLIHHSLCTLGVIMRWARIFLEL